jgi:hypothetical protein
LGGSPQLPSFLAASFVLSWSANSTLYVLEDHTMEAGAERVSIPDLAAVVSPDDVPLSVQREQLRQQLATAAMHSLAEQWWFSVRQSIARLTHMAPGAIPFWLAVAIVLMLNLTVSYIFSFILGETQRWNFVRDDVIWAGYTWIFVLLMRNQYRRQFRLLQATIIDSIIFSPDLSNLGQWATRLTATRRQFIRTLILAGASGGISSLSYVFTTGAFVGFGQILSFAFNWYLIVMLMLPAFPIVSFFQRLASYHFTLYTLNPSKSPVLIRLQQSATSFMYTYALVSTLFLVLVFLLPGVSLLTITGSVTFIFVTWIPIIVLFLVSQRSFAHVVQQCKTGKLSEIQSKIMMYESGHDLTEQKTIETVKQLMDYHDRLESTPDSLLNIQSLFNLISSLILPLLGTLLGNIDTALRLLQNIRSP